MPARMVPVAFLYSYAGTRTAQSHGISTPERKRLAEAAHYMRRRYPDDCMFFVAELHGEDRRAISALARQLKSHIVLKQGRAGFPPWWVEVIESAPHPHSNIIAPLPADAAERIALAAAYAGHMDVQAVEERKGGMRGLVGYLLKETTPQAAFGTGIRRNKGSHVLEGGGDRVKLSKALETILLVEGRIEPWKHKYAARTAAAAETVTVPDPVTPQKRGQTQTEAAA